MLDNKIAKQKEHERDYNHWYYLNHKEELSIKKKKKYQKLRKCKKKYSAYLTKHLEYYKMHKERQNELSRIWTRTHKTRRNAYLRNRYNNDLVYREHYINYHKEWEAKNKDKVMLYKERIRLRREEIKMLNKIM